ncbi:MAG TPA: UV DNA damage repair endonuclease UvsE, partial [Candidatus Nanoarchaeia archaeon]|nr:UV DNA damage repair endonuclease UvsE [Candidatus Nanoarchaeia archaeon]
MKIGYACINNSIGCTTNSTFRLASYSEQRFKQTVENNLNCLLKLLQWNKENNIFFFRMSSDIIPFASHEICKFDWKNHFKSKLEEIGSFVKQNNMRISMHPDQFVLINALNKEIVQ